RLPRARLAEEIAAVLHEPRPVPKRDAEGVAALEQDRPQWIAPVNVLVRVEMRGVAPEQASEGAELPFDLPSHRPLVLQRNPEIGALPLSICVEPLAEIDVQPHREAWADRGGIRR